MTGGTGYVVDPERSLPQNYNPGSVDLERVETADDANDVRRLIEQHRNSTGSQTADDWLRNYPDSLDETTKVMPKGFERA